MASNEDNEETFGEGFAIETEGALEDTSPSVDGKHTCKICSEKYSNPRVLSCLHVFCQGCLDKRLVDETGDSKATDGVIVCPECQQESKVKSNGAASLPCDYVMTNILDLCAIQDMALVCTSCKTKKVAMSRCAECAQYLCAHCNTAHQLMRCFEDHHVVDFEDIRKTALEPNEPVPIHKPIFCASHPTEKLKFFCPTCEIPICNECVVTEHLAHQHGCNRLEDALPRQREELEKLVRETKAKSALCHEVSASLENALSELQQQHDNAKDLILETYQSYKAILEKCKEDRLQQLKQLHEERELKIMDTCHNVEKTSEKIEDACKFTNQLLKHGNAVEILSLKNVVSTQLLNIIQHTPKPAVNFNLKFETALSAFEKAVQTTFGSFSGSEESSPPTTSSMPTAVKEESPAPVTSTAFSAPNSLVNGDFSPSPTFSGGGGGVIGNGGGGSGGFPAVPQRSSGSGFSVPTSASSMINGYPSSVTSSPVSMQSSYDGEIGQITGFGVTPNVLHSPDAATAMPPKREVIRIREYNLHQLANLADKTELEPPASPASSPTPPNLLTEILSSAMSPQSHAFNNLQALAKLGNFSVNDQADLGADSITGTMNGSQALIPCGRSSPSSIGLASPSLSINTTFPGMAGSTSILTQSDDLLPEPSMSGFGSPLSPQFPISGSSYNHPRDPSGKLMAMQVRLKFGQMGTSKGQFNSPHGFCLGWDEDIVVADTNNHRIQVFEKNGVFKFQFGVAGKEEGLLYYPRKVAVIRESGKFVVCDRGNERSRLQTFTKNGHFIRKIAIRYIEILAGLAVTRNGNIVAVDSVSPTVFVIAESGEILTWFNCSDYMMEPSDITVWGNEFFVCDFKGHAVVVFGEDGSYKRRIGREPLTSYPNGIDISDAGDVLVGDSHGNRFHIVVFNRQGEKLSEFECPYVKVSRCCGLKITSEGYVVTVAKNNHHVLVLNTLYIH